MRRFDNTHRTRGLAPTVIGACLALAALMPVSGQAAAPQTFAPGGPGALSHFDLARKDCLGTARNTTSKVWYTVAGGVLSDVYYPTVDNTNVETLQYIVTDGSTFTNLQSRDMTYTTKALDRGGMECQVTATAKSGAYSIVTDYFTDPGRNSLVMQVRLRNNTHTPLQLFVRFDPSVNGNGGGGSGNGGADSATIDTSTGHVVLVSSDTKTATNAVQRDSTHALTQLYTDASNGNVVQTARVAVQDAGEEDAVTLTLGFGADQASAVQSAQGSLRSDAEAIQESYRSGWSTYDAKLAPPPRHLAGLTAAQVRQLSTEYYLSANVIKASEDKTFPGAIVASLASPWGQAISAGDPNNAIFGSYREVFARDLYEAWTGLVADGDLATARNAVTFLFSRQQQADGSMPRNSLVNGKLAPDSFNTQLDEVSYPILMAWTLGMTSSSLYQQHIRPAAYFVVSHGPSFGPERWEEQGGFSPSTISAEVAGLVAGATIADANGDTATANVARGVADDWQRSLPGWAVTTNGPLASHPYYIRLSKTGDPNAAISYNVGNGGPTLDQRAIIDQGFLEMVRLGLTPASDPTIVESLPVVDATIKADTSSGTGFHRYNGDGYGDGAGDGHPWAPSGKGTGHLWPALAGERGEYELATGQVTAGWQRLIAMLGGASGPGLIPEQVWELPNLAASPFGTDPTAAP